MNLPIRSRLMICLGLFLIAVAALGISYSIQDESEPITGEDCATCHEKGRLGTVITEDLALSIHRGYGCLDCHSDKTCVPHKKTDFLAGFQGCAVCHEDFAQEYTAHGRTVLDAGAELPACSACHGDHDILPSSDPQSRAFSGNIAATCGVCHEDRDVIEKIQTNPYNPVEIYYSSVHGQSPVSGQLTAATCTDCHTGGRTAHQIYSQGHPDSAVNHFNIPDTCGRCHEPEREEYWISVHGELAGEGKTDTPVCTHCHGEHGILFARDPRSPVSAARLAESTCTPCHESISLTERYGISTGRRITFIDNYHGKKSKSGDRFVANCVSCHGVHLILPGFRPESKINPENLRETCGECHPSISAEVAATPIHGLGDAAVENKAAEIVKVIYIVAIFAIIGLMAFHWMIDFFKKVRNVIKKPQVRRMTRSEVWQHWLLLSSFLVLVLTGFALRFGDAWFSRLLFGYDRGFQIRGILHRLAAVVLMIDTIWHSIHLMTRRGRKFFRDMIPRFSDVKQLFQKMSYSLGLSKKEPRFKRFSYVEKAEYCFLFWGNAIMIVTGLILWFENFFVRLLSRSVYDVVRVIHFYEAILAALAIVVWHLYANVFNPSVYPMNPSWLTGKMPREMFVHEHPEAEIEDQKN